MKLLKRIGAIVIAIMLIVTGTQFDGIISAANESTDNHVNVINVAKGATANESYIYLYVSDAKTVPGTGANCYVGPNIEMTGVNYSKNPDIIRISGGSILRLTFYTGSLLVDDKAEITLKQGKYTCKYQNEYSISFAEDYTIVYDAETETWSEKINIQYTEATITGFEQPYNQDGTTRFKVSLSTAPTVQGVYSGLDIRVNDSVDKGAYAYAEVKEQLLYIILSKELTDADTKITIGVSQGISEGERTVGISITEEYTITYSSDTGLWSDPNEDVIDITITGLNRQPHVGTDNTWIDFNVSAPVSDADGLQAFSGYTVNASIAGKQYSTGVYVYNNKDLGYNTLSIHDWNLKNGVVPQDGDYVTIKAGVITHNDDTTKKFRITEDFTIEYNGTKGIWEAQIDTAYTDMSATGLHSQGIGDGHWRFLINVDNVFPGKADEVMISYEAPVVKVGDDAVTSLQLTETGGKLWLILWSYTNASPDKGTTITIPRGKYRDLTDNSVGIKIKQDIVLIYDGVQWLYNVVADEEASFALDLETQNGGTASGIYLTSNDNRTFTESVNIPAVKSLEINGILYNGETTDGFLRHDAVGKYYVGLNGVKAANGDMVTIQGIFEYNLYAVSYEPLTLYYDGTQWHTCYTAVPKQQYGSEPIDFYTEEADPLPYEPAWEKMYSFVQGGIYNSDGTLHVRDGGHGVKLLKLGANRYVLFGTHDDLELKDKQTSVIMDGIIMDAESRVAVKIQRTTLVNDGINKWTVGTTSETYDKALSFRVRPEFCKMDQDNITLVIEPSQGILGEPNQATWSGLSVAALKAEGRPHLDTKVLSASVMTKTDRGMLSFTIPKSELESLGTTYKLFVKTGMLKVVDSHLVGVENADIKPIYNSKDCFIYVNEYGIGSTQYVEKYSASALDGVHGDTNSVQWTVPTNETMTQTASFFAKDIDSGVFINGVRYENIPVQMASATTLQAFLNNHYTAVAGDHVMIIGTFEGEDEIMEIVATAATYNGSAWVEADTTFTKEVVLDITDTEYVVEGTSVAVTNIATNKQVNQSVLYQAGNYQVVREIGNVTLTYYVSLYRPNDINQNNEYDVIDLVKMLKKERLDEYTMTDIETMAAKNCTSDTVRSYILGKTKADETLPTVMIGETTNSNAKYITSVSGTMNGTTVIGMSDTDAAYKPTTDYDAYGYDYVLDIQVEGDRELRILQLSDTQIIDSTQARAGRANDIPYETYLPENRNAVLYDCMDATIAKAKPDLILIAGDIIFGEFDDKGLSQRDLVEKMESYKIPWAPVYGNHDNEIMLGVKWQNELYANATYCLYYAGHDIGGNSNYSIGLAKNGELQRAVYMMDSNFCANVRAYNEDGTLNTSIQHPNADGDASNGEVITTVGFTALQKEWYRLSALRANEVASTIAGEDKVIPSMLCYHVPTVEIKYGAIAACYEEKDASSYLKYTIGTDNYAQNGDNGVRDRGSLCGDSLNTTILDVMNEVGGDGASFGHQHLQNFSTTYGGVRWTFGLKTGGYDASPDEQGGTLFVISNDGSSFEVEQIKSNS